MGKNKGRQCGGFPTKAMRAAFTTEWHTAANSVELNRGRRNNNANKNSTSSLTRPKFRLSHLQNLVKDRIYEDRLVEQRVRRALQQQAHDSTTANVNTTTTLQQNTNRNTLMYDSQYDDYREDGLTLLCIKALAPVLSDYIISLGRDKLHYLLSFLPGKTITALSVELSAKGLWNKDVLYVIAQQPHLSRLVVSLSPNDAVTEEDLEEALVFQPESSLTNPYRVVPESWEDECIADMPLPGMDKGDVHQSNNTIRHLQRVDLRNMACMSSETLVSIITSQTTHVSLDNVLNSTSGPQFIDKVVNGDFQFHVLDVSNCATWMTAELLVRLEAIATNLCWNGHNQTSNTW